LVGGEVRILVGGGVGFEVGILAEGVAAEVVAPIVVVVVVVAAGVVVALVVVELQTQEVVLVVVVVILVLVVVDAGGVDVVSEPQLTQTGGSKLHGHHSYPCAHWLHCSCDTSRGLSELHEPDPEPPDPEPPDPDPEPPEPNEPEKKTSRTLWKLEALSPKPSTGPVPQGCVVH
jgi:hypothetical protein